MSKLCAKFRGLTGYSSLSHAKLRLMRYAPFIPLVLLPVFIGCSHYPMNREADAIEEELMAKKENFKLCYDHEAGAKKTQPVGRVDARFVIGPDGNVKGARVIETTLRSPAIENCIIGEIQKVRFKPFENSGDTVVNYPFKFHVD